MHMQNLVKFYKFVLKILSGNEIMMDGLNDGPNDGQPKSSTAPHFQLYMLILSIYRHISNLVKFFEFVLKILSQMKI